jgi:hypothetical protein
MYITQLLRNILCHQMGLLKIYCYFLFYCPISKQVKGHGPSRINVFRVRISPSGNRDVVNYI